MFEDDYLPNLIRGDDGNASKLSVKTSRVHLPKQETCNGSE